MHKTKRMVTNCSVERRLSSGIQRDRALGQGVVSYLTKPIDEEILLGYVKSALQRTKSDENPYDISISCQRRLVAVERRWTS